MENYLRIILEIEYIINFILLMIFYLHMFQLNSYSFKKNWNWLKKNKIEIITKISIILITLLLILLKGGIFASILIMIDSIYLNRVKKKSKIPLKYTSRIQINIITFTIIVICLGMLFKNYMLLYLAIINIIAPIFIFLANYINSPIRLVRYNKYIKEAKKIINDSPELIVIGVTGTYGKTSVKNYLAKILSSKYQVLVTPQNYNTTLGVVKTIRENLKATHQIFICEMGATKIGDIKEICDIVKPKYGIITSIGPQHLETFGNIENILETKFELAESVAKKNGKMFLNYSNEYIKEYSKGMNNIITYGTDNSDFIVHDIVSTYKGISFKINSEDIEFKTKIIGKHNAINLAGCIAIARSLNISYEDIKSQIRKLENVEHRLNIVKRQDLTIIDDAYNANPVSSKSALDTLNEFNGSKILVTPGLIELDDKEYKYNFELGEYAAKICDYVFLVGKHSEAVRDGLISKNYNKNNMFFVNSPELAIDEIRKLKIDNDKIVLLENDLPDNYN